MYYFSYQNRSGYLFCPRVDDVVHGSTLDCFSCQLYRGALQGKGRECEIGNDDQVIEIDDPYAYMETKRTASEGGE